MENIEVSRVQVVEALATRAPRAMHIGEICTILKLPSQARASVQEILEELRDEGYVREMPGLRFRLEKGTKVVKAKKAPTPKPVETRDAPAYEDERPAPKLSSKTGGVIGRLTMNARGFGFVAAEDGGPDVFIPPPSLSTAMHGDRVRVNAHPSAKGREGAIVEILERATKRIVGILKRAGRHDYIEPSDPRVRGPVPVTGKLPPGAVEGLMVVGEIVRYPEREDEAAEARVTQAIGRPGVASVEVAAIKIRDGIVEEFPVDVVAEADKIPETVPEADKEGREDLRPYDLVTIDPEDARDHDDAVWAERIKTGFRIIVAIADVSHYVREGTAIDREAIARGTSIYLPDRAIPMLPHQLSSNLASLVPNQDRLTLAVEVHLGLDGSIQNYRYIEGLMRSGARLTYGSVARALGLTEEVPEQKEAQARIPLLKILQEASAILRKKRKARGSLDFDLPEARVKLDPKTDEPIDVYRSRMDPGVRQAYALIEDMMLLANEVVAADLAKRSVPAIYRVHGKPDEKKIMAFSDLAASLGHTLDPDAGENPRKLTGFLAQIEGTPHQQALGYLLLRAMQQATYDTTNIGHFGLAARDYLHFTSPIRRYPDLAVHRVVRAVIHEDQKAIDALGKKLQSWAADSSRLERRAMLAEREAVDLYRAILMRDKIGEEFDATITSVTGWGFYCAFDKPFVESLVPVDALGDDHYEMDEHGIRLVGSRSGHVFSMGDKVRVVIESVSIQDRQITSRVVDHTAAAELPRPRFSQVRRPEGDDRKKGKDGPGGAARGRPGGLGLGSGRNERPRLSASGRGGRAERGKSLREAINAGGEGSETPRKSFGGHGKGSAGRTFGAGKSAGGKSGGGKSGGGSKAGGGAKKGRKDKRR
ncbi:MAG: ribonuclease R [Sandaracinaceae bacterium]|nr:ribonuclease R [Sandaracinaceae bacterium]